MLRRSERGIGETPSSWNFETTPWAAMLVSRIKGRYLCFIFGGGILRECVYKNLAADDAWGARGYASRVSTLWHGARREVEVEIWRTCAQMLGGRVMKCQKA